MMLYQDENAEQIQNVLPPWQLQGQGYICLLHRSTTLNIHNYTQEQLRNRLQIHSQPLMIFVDYTHSPVGPYYELLFIPGYFVTEEGKTCFSIGRIFVSSMSSVINGRRNWGIPKEIAQFKVKYNEKGCDHMIVSQHGKVFAELTFSSWLLPMPFHTSMIPKAWHTFIQVDNDVIFQFQPQAKGWLRPARLMQSSIDPAIFPAIRPEDVMASVKITSFQMRFPEAMRFK